MHKNEPGDYVFYIGFTQEAACPSGRMRYITAYAAEKEASRIRRRPMLFILAGLPVVGYVLRAQILGA